jgi:hypothetical protein
MNKAIAEPRPPTGEELALLERLLSRDFPGRDALMRQIPCVRVRWIDADGSPAMLLSFSDGVLPAEVEHRTPPEAEGIAHDSDGQTIHFVLHVVDGLLNEIEVFREDGQPVQRLPEVCSISLA